jgi:hypothetical protein
MNRCIRNVIAVSSVGLLCATQGCELAVQLDRSLVDAGDDAGCAICSGPAEGEGGDDAAAVDATADEATDAANADATEANADATSTDAPNSTNNDAANADATSTDGAPETSTADSSVDTGG